MNDLVRQLRLGQPQVSKHLRVLREVGLVHVREDGVTGCTASTARPLKSIHEWVKNYEQAWNERFDRMDDVLDELKREEDSDGGRHE